MAQRRNRTEKSKQDETIVDLIKTREQAQSFFETNQKMILSVLVGVVIVIAGFIAYKLLYKAPREKKAQAQMYKAEQAFAQDSTTKALTDAGGGYPGFIDMVKRYGTTNAGDVANLYAAESYMKEGKYEVALDYLNDYSGSGKIAEAIKNGLKGDAYSELGKMDKALSAYEKAANTDNEFFAPYYLFKLGLLNEKQGNIDDALEAYQTIATEYPNSQQGQSIEAFIARVSE
jgi:tetratricopeptide (TPR) repeat protein